MKTTLLSLAVALALGAAAGCDKTPDQRATQTSPSAPAGSGGTATQQSNHPTTPAPADAAKKEGSQPPVQGREDVRQPEQRKDFQHKGDGSGPKPGG